VSALLDSHPLGARGRVLVVGPPEPDRTGKLNAMIGGFEAARGELVAVSDSDTRPPRDLLRLLVEALLDRQSAVATFAPVATFRAPRTAGEAAYALLVNAWYGPEAAHAAQPDGTLPYIMGELMGLKRPALAAIGGFEAARRQLVDDMYLGQRFAQAGWKYVTVPWRLPIVTEPISVGQFVRLFCRWVAFSGPGLPRSFQRQSWLRGGAAMLGPVCAQGGVALGSGAAAGAGVAAVVAWSWGQSVLHARFSGHRLPLRYFWVPALVPWLGAALALSLKLWPRVDWRGRRHTIGDGTRLLAGH
jgi:ceramide glucosyltransferase